jgi:hypothetical protein
MLRASTFVREHLGDAPRWHAVVGYRRAEALSRAGSRREAAAAARDALVLATDTLEHWDLVEARYVAGLCFLDADDAPRAAELLEPALAGLDVCCPRALLRPQIVSALARARSALAERG